MAERVPRATETLRLLAEKLAEAADDPARLCASALEVLLAGSQALGGRVRSGTMEVRRGEETQAQASTISISLGLGLRAAPVGSLGSLASLELYYAVAPASDDEEAHLLAIGGTMLAQALERARLLHELALLTARSEGEIRDRTGHAVRAERMIALGTLAQGVVAELERPLTAVHANLRSIIDDLDRESLRSGGPGPLSRKLADQIRDVVGDSFLEVDRLARLAHDVRRLVPSDQAIKARVDINLLVQSALNLTRHRFQQKAQVRSDLAALPEITCHADRLVQAFANLLANAAEAIRGSGEILVRTRRLGGRISIEFADTGIGISEEDLARIFDPFFTTKRFGEAAGLGLAIVREVVVEHGGEVFVESRVGEGTRFEILLPVS